MRHQPTSQWLTIINVRVPHVTVWVSMDDRRWYMRFYRTPKSIQDPHMHFLTRKWNKRNRAATKSDKKLILTWALECDSGWAIGRAVYALAQAQWNDNKPNDTYATTYGHCDIGDEMNSSCLFNEHHSSAQSPVKTVSITGCVHKITFGGQRRQRR